MTLSFCILMFCVGLFFLVWGSNLFIDSAVTVASHFHIPETVIGATVLSFGTTLPEVLFSTTAAYHGLSDMSLGNAFGSIICNTGFIAGFMLILSPLRPNASDLKSIKSIYGFIVLAIAIFLFSGIYLDGIVRLVGILLLIICAFFIKETVRGAKEQPVSCTEDTFHPTEFIKLILEAALLYLGATFLITYGPVLARTIGVPEVVISLTFIALGTSLPELITSLTALRKKHTALSMGNILGANLLNLVLVCGLSSVIRPLPLSQRTMNTELPLCFLFVSTLCIPVLVRKKASRLQGAALFIGYLLYVYVLFQL